MKKEKIIPIIKHIAALMVIFGIVGISLWFVKYKFVQTAAEKSKTVYVSDIYDSLSREMENEKAFSQPFSVVGDIYGVTVRFHTGGAPGSGVVEARLYDEAGENLLAFGSVRCPALVNDGYSAIVFDSPYVNTEGTDNYILTITPVFDSGEGYLRMWLNSADDNIAMGVVSNVVNIERINLWFGIICAVILIGIGVLYTACFILKRPAHTVFAIALLCRSLAFTLVLPPYSSPDEEAHINSAIRLTNQLSGYPTGPYSGDVYRRLGDSRPIFEDKHTTVFTYEYLREHMGDKGDKSPLVKTDNNWVVEDFFGVYSVGALGIALGRAFNLSYPAMLYLGRFLNMRFFALCAYFAVKITPVGKEIFMTLSLLPITLHLVNSFSRDVFVISIAFLYRAVLLKLIKQDEKISIGQWVVLLLLTALLIPSKFIYFPISFLSLFAVKKIEKLPKKQIVAVFAAVAVIMGTVILVRFDKNTELSSNLISSLGNNITSLEALMEANPDATLNLNLVLQNPMFFIKLLLETVFENGSYYVKSITGGVLGYNSIYISDFFVFIFLALIGMSVFASPLDSSRLKKSERFAFGGVFLVIFVIVLYVGVHWTPVSAQTIYGIQGKYLMPALPLGLLAVKNKVVSFNKNIFNGLCFAAYITGIYTALNAFVIIMQR